DLELANFVISYDDVVDSLFNQVKSDIIGLIREEKYDGEAIIDMLMIAKYLERIADHATNIAEWVVFSVTGKHEEEE
ncbi:MAG: PhoU domain-containing protein, partial [Oscillospiraceae bacterium]